MKRTWLVLMKIALTVAAAIAVMAICPATAWAGGALIDFEDLPSSPFESFTKSGVTFTAVDGGAMRGQDTPNGTIGLISNGPPFVELRADIIAGATSVSVDLGDYDMDSDRLFLEIFDASDVSLDFIDLVIPGSFTGMETLSLSNPNISYAIFGARDAVSGSSVFADNFEYVPEPAAFSLLALGGLAVVRRKRRSRR